MRFCDAIQDLLRHLPDLCVLAVRSPQERGQILASLLDGVSIRSGDGD